MDESAREVAVLLTSELVTNALRHAAPPIDITLGCDGRGVHVTVTDGHRDRPVLRPPSPEADSGRGMQLVNALATAWGVRARPKGKDVWFSIDHDGTTGEPL